MKWLLRGNPMLTKKEPEVSRKRVRFDPLYTSGNDTDPVRLRDLHAYAKSDPNFENRMAHFTNKMIADSYTYKSFMPQKDLVELAQDEYLREMRSLIRR